MDEVREFKTMLLQENNFNINIQKYIERIRYKNKIIIWGADRWIADFLEMVGLANKVKYYADNNEKMWGGKNGFMVLSPAQVVETLREDEDYYIIIGSVHLNTIRSQLIKLGISGDKIDIEGFLIAENYYSYSDTTPYTIVNARLQEYAQVFKMLNDERSKQVFLGLLNFKLSMNNEFLIGISEANDQQYFDKKIIRLSENEVFCDCGSYNGDTLEKFIELTEGRYKKYIAIEADKDIYNELNEKIAYNNYKNVQTYNVACWSEKTKLKFQSSQTAGHISAIGEVLVDADTLNNILKNEEVTFLKMDIEGAEEMALKGATEVIVKHLPILAICIYHNLEDFQKLPLFLKKINNDYSFFIRHYTEMFDLETVCYAIPKNRLI